MDVIGNQQIFTYSGRSKKIESSTCGAVRKASGHLVENYMDLATKIAELQFRNRDFVLMYRGQKGDYKNKSGNTSLKPTIMRAITSSSLVPTTTTIKERFEKLGKAEKSLVEEYKERKFLGLRNLQRQQILRWSIIQHYEICETPLLDVTHSLRIAASFASEGADQQAYIFVLGVPHISGAITASAEAGLQIVRLASVCPPSAVRPHIQEGYLLGEYPDFSAVEQKQNYAHFELDFGRRLIAKFRFNPDSFWGNSGYFPQVTKKALYPSLAQDPMCELAEAVRRVIEA
jgi:hypothetical protein